MQGPERSTEELKQLASPAGWSVHYPRTLKLLPIVDISILFELLGLAKRFAAQFGDTGSDTNAQQDPASRADAKKEDDMLLCSSWPAATSISSFYIAFH